MGTRSRSGWPRAASERSLRSLLRSTCCALGAYGLLVATPLLLGPVLLSRFDLWPTMLTAAALVALLADRRRSSAVAVGAAIAAKLYPAVLVPLAFIWVYKRSGARAAAVWVLTLMLVLAAFFLPIA